MRVTFLLLLSAVGCGTGPQEGRDLIQRAAFLDAADPALGCVRADDGELVVDAPVVLNRYFAPLASVEAGATLIPVDEGRGAPVAIAAGDRLLVVQMQGAMLDPQLAMVSGTLTAGTWELVVATGPATDGGIPVEGQGTGGGLAHDYTLRAGDDAAGPASWQALRIPQLANLTLSDGGEVWPEPWDGRTGGILAVDVAGTVTFDGGTLDASGMGFRGGRAETLLRNGAGQRGAPGHKGEGLAGGGGRLFSSATGTFTDAAAGFTLPDGEGTHAPATGGGNARLSNDAAGGGGGHGGDGGIGGAGARRNRANAGAGGAA
ncbi:MAG: hypothetical protein AAF602_13610, partial [Myxococcota bacterium]